MENSDSKPKSGGMGMSLDDMISAQKTLKKSQNNSRRNNNRRRGGGGGGGYRGNNNNNNNSRRNNYNNFNDGGRRGGYNSNRRDNRRNNWNDGYNDNRYSRNRNYNSEFSRTFRNDDEPYQRGGRDNSTYSAEKSSRYPAGRTIRIKNLHYEISDDDIRALFREAGEIANVVIDYDDSGRSEGTATVVYNSVSAANKAVELFNGVVLDDTQMVVSIHRESSERSGIRINLGDSSSSRQVSMDERFSSNGGRQDEEDASWATDEREFGRPSNYYGSNRNYNNYGGGNPRGYNNNNNRRNRNNFNGRNNNNNNNNNNNSGRNSNRKRGNKRGKPKLSREEQDKALREKLDADLNKIASERSSKAESTSAEVVVTSSEVAEATKPLEATEN